MQNIMVHKNVNLMPMRDPSQNSRGQEKAQVIVTSLVPWPCPRSAPFSIESNTIPHLDLSITVEIRTKFFQKYFPSCGHSISEGKKELCLRTDFSLLFSTAEFACTDAFESPHALKSFLLDTHTRPKLNGTESLRILRHKPLSHAQCQIGAKTVCSYS